MPTSTNLKLITAYFSRLEREGYHGTIEVTLQGGRMRFTRENRSRQDHEIAADSWDELSSDARTELRDYFKDNAKFAGVLRSKT